MNIRNQEKLKLKFCIIFLIYICNSITSTRGQDFQFDNDNAEDFQTILSEPLEVVSKAQQATKSQDKATKCPQSENKIFLSLVLRTHNWDNVVEKKRQKAINKLSKFLMVPKENLILDDVSRAEIHEMSTSAIRSGRNHLNRNTKLGRIQFLIGCGKSVFPGEKLIANQMPQQMKDNTIDEITGLDFGWWAIWKQKQQLEDSKISRTKREANDIEDDEDDDYYEDGENDDEDDEESATEVPITTQHPHRHHHGDSGLTTMPSSSSTEKLPKVPIIEEDEDNYDDEYEDEEDDRGEVTQNPPSKQMTTERIMTTETTTELLTTTPVPATQPPTTTETPTTPEKLTTTPAPTTTTTEQFVEEVNTPPFVKTRIPKQALTAGKVYTFIIPENTFFDQEDGTKLKLALTDKNDQPLKSSSWLQFNPETREIYALPLENTVSRWNYILRATDSATDSTTESLDITVQQHKSHRSVNHEISIALKLNEKFANNVDWELKVIQGIAETMGDNTNGNIVVRDIRFGTQDPTSIVFVYTNETIPKDRCPEETLDELVKKLDQDKLNENLGPDFNVKSVTGQQIGSCMKASVPTKKPSKSPVVNYGPQLRNPIDRINATLGNLLVFKVPMDTFYDPEDANDLTLSLRTADNVKVDAHHWLQFDSKNNEFYGIPKSGDIGNREYLLQAEDSGGKTSTDALIVYVNHWSKRDFGVLFEMELDYSYETFNVSLAQRRFVERVASALGDDSTAHIHIRNIRPLHHNGHILVSYYNTTLHKPHTGCPSEEIEEIKNVLVQSDGLVRDKVRESLGADFKLQSVRLIPMGSCQGHGDPPTHDEVTIKPDEALPPPVGRDDYLLTFIVPAAIIITMLLIAAIIACILYRRRLTGKMELGDEEERKSFRSKGIPVIFQDELDEKPEIGNKSPVILKDEKPPLLPPSYSSTNGEENEDMDDYVPPPAVVMGGRESRGKSPVTPSYRKPPPYVSP